MKYEMLCSADKFFLSVFLYSNWPRFFKKEFLSFSSVLLSTCCDLWTKNMLEKHVVEKYLDHSLSEVVSKWNKYTEL